MKKKYAFKIVKLKNEECVMCLLLFILNSTRKIHLAKKRWEKRNPRPTLRPPKYASVKEWDFVANS